MIKSYSACKKLYTLIMKKNANSYTRDFQLF